MTDFDTLLSRAALLFGYHEEDLLKRGRTPRLVAARQAVMWAARYEGYGAVEIGRWMQRDHSTVLYGAAQAAGRADSDPEYAQLLRQLAGISEPAEVPPARPVRIMVLPPGSRWWLHQAYGCRLRLTLAA